MAEPYIQKRTCNGICKKVQVKKPVGEGRYGSGQGHCQTCDTWIDHVGCHMKDGSPATKDSVGWFCNCCNYRVRQRPRNKVYKEKLRKWLTRDQVKIGTSVRIRHENNKKVSSFGIVAKIHDTIDSHSKGLLAELKSGRKGRVEYTFPNKKKRVTIKQDTNYAAMIFTKKINHKRNMNTKNEENSETEKNIDEIKEIENTALKKYEATQKQIESSKQIQEFTKDMDFSMIDNSNSEKNLELEEKIMESQKLMEETLSGKKELQGIFLKLKEKIKHMNPNTIRKLSREL